MLATREDLEILARDLLKALDEYDTGDLRILRVSAEHGLPISKNDEVPVLWKYATVPDVRTDRVVLEFRAVPTLTSYHQKTVAAQGRSGFGIFKFIWLVALPVVGLMVALSWLVSLFRP